MRAKRAFRFDPEERAWQQKPDYLAAAVGEIAMKGAPAGNQIENGVGGVALAIDDSVGLDQSSCGFGCVQRRKAFSAGHRLTETHVMRSTVGTRSVLNAGGHVRTASPCS